MEDFYGDLYNIPPPARAVNTLADRTPEEAPPRLMPKKSDSIRTRESFAALDRRRQGGSPTPAARSSAARKKCDAGLLDALNPIQPAVRENKGNVTKPKMWEGADVLNNVGDGSEVRWAPQAPKRTSGNSSGIKVENRPSSSKMNRPVPKPRMRTMSKPVSISEDQVGTQEVESGVVINSNESTAQISHPDLAEKSEKRKEFTDTNNHDPSSSLSFQLPPDADTLEALLDNELDQNYNVEKEHSLLTVEDKQDCPATYENGGKPQEKVLANEDTALRSPATTQVQRLDPNPGLTTNNDFGGNPNSMPNVSKDNSANDRPTQSLRLSDLIQLDPLWQEKSSIPASSSKESTDAPQEVSHARPASDVYGMLWEDGDTQVTVEPGELVTKETLVDSDDYSLPDKSNTKEALMKSETSGLQEPPDLPPPLPTQGPDVSQPPPVPPRPGSSPVPAVPERPTVLIDSQKTASGNDSSINFDSLPTPIFSATPSGEQDPFADSGFDYDCFKFNARAEVPTQPVPEVPALPSPRVKPREPITPSPSPKAGGRDGMPLPPIPSPGTRPRGSIPLPALPSEPKPQDVKSVPSSIPSPARPAVPEPQASAGAKPKQPLGVSLPGMSSAAGGRPVGLPGMTPPHEDPDRISRFVVPPPGAHLRDLGVEYELAKEEDGRDSSDSDDVLGPIPSPSFLPPDRMDNTLPRTHSPKPKKNIREGFLSKQGGFNANKGWRKRWVVFDGSKLKYYNSNKAQVSNRVIPVQCIENVEIDVKPDSYRFKVLTNLKDRVFVFAAETRDDCTMWASILMAEVVKYKSNKGEHDTIPQTKPDKEGFIVINNKKEYYVTINGQMLRYYHSLEEDYQYGSPVHEIDMKLASVKDTDCKKLKLQLWVHYGHFDLEFPSEQEMQQWRLAMEDAIAEGLADDTVLVKVYENISNQQCADCGADNPHWASINLGIVVCKNCAGIHRMFDFRITRIKSLRMDTRVWSPNLIELMVTIGNANANLFWAAKLTPGEAIRSSALMEQRKDFITKKYVEKRFADKHPLSNLRPAIGEELIKAAREDNLLDMMRILFSGADIMYRQSGDGPTAFELVKEGRQRRVMEFLYQNGGDPQSLSDNVQDEMRLREDVKLQGFLNKTGPLGKSNKLHNPAFERRWCVLEHGALTYYTNEKATIAKGAVDRKDMLMISSVETDSPQGLDSSQKPSARKMGYQFELSTTLKENRTFIFSSDIKDDASEWIRTIAKLMSPVAVMEHVGMIDIKFAAYAHMKELVDEWHQTFLVFSWRGLNYMNKDLKLDYIDLRKASSIKMQDASVGYQNQGPCFVISSTGRSVYLQASLSKDTEKMFHALQYAITGSGAFLTEQALTSSDVPVIVDRCITHIEVHGLQEKGLYRTAGQNSRVQALLDDFRRDALSVSLSDYPVAEVTNTLKRFLRELDDSVFGRINYQNWICAAAEEDSERRLNTFKYYLDQMPTVNRSTLKRIILHLYQVSQHCQNNLMGPQNLAACFAPTLMRVNKDEGHIPGEYITIEIRIIVDLLDNKDRFFQADEQERIKAQKIAAAMELMNTRQSVAPRMTSQGYLVSLQVLDSSDSVNIEVNETITAAEAINKRDKSHFLAVPGVLVLHEVLFSGSLLRPLFPEDCIAKTTNRWVELSEWENIRMSLSVRSMELLDKLDANYNNQNHSLQAELHYSDQKSKKFNKKTVRFQQYQLAIYNKSRDTNPSVCWNVENLVFYIGSWSRKSSPSKHCLTFLVDGEKYSKAFGHCLCFSSEEDLYSWAAVLYAVQNPSKDGLLSWTSVSAA